ncbi:sigma-70 family RNA polymerase sigma factor [Streptomyces hebeiensis]|uniref:Sigma-70 family RNA polymerase sigma factor n=1 Tax=Streptomyces hebeiensis TaxID=229486 RepID=A0ABN1UW11_9ACTN
MAVPSRRAARPPRTGAPASSDDLFRVLLPLVRAEAEAEAAAAGAEARDLEQGVWVRLLERLAHAPAERHAPGGRRPRDASDPYVPAPRAPAAPGLPGPYGPAQEAPGPGDGLARWVRDAVREEARHALRIAAHEGRYVRRDGPAAGPETDPERLALRTDRRRTLRAAVGRTPGRCPEVLTAMLSPKDPTYREIAGELGMSQGSLGPLRSRCLGCLRRLLVAEVGLPGRRGKER